MLIIFCMVRFILHQKLIKNMGRAVSIITNLWRCFRKKLKRGTWRKKIKIRKEVLSILLF